MAVTLVILGLFFAMTGWVWLLIGGFMEGVPWGVGIIFIPFFCFVFSLFHWPEYKAPTFMCIGGIVLIFLGRLIA